MRLLIDEMHSPRVTEALRADGWDVIGVVMDESLRGRPDAALLEFAAENGRAIVTENGHDFARLASQVIAAGDGHGGIVVTDPVRFLRKAPAYPNNVIEALRRFLAAPPFAGDSWIWWLK